MKVKVLSGNLMGADYKPLSVGAEIEIKDDELATLWVKARLVKEIKASEKKVKG